ncbi:hypothetical protein ROLI_029190 [Roseobacter fucihabitans]|uniref:Uncharacterized protein n=1 Tax=Roseobacter fucihabitans TaxID=1537242 RepID=A0ABZ2BYP0_9RHOB|nr:hypothetical protein [Roseobacter litoralis]
MTDPTGKTAVITGLGQAKGRARLRGPMSVAPPTVRGPWVRRKIPTPPVCAE